MEWWCWTVTVHCAHLSKEWKNFRLVRGVLTEGIILHQLSIIDLFQLDNNMLSTSSIRTAFSILVAFWTHFSTTLLANLCWDRWRTLPLTQFTGKRNIKTWKIWDCTPKPEWYNYIQECLWQWGPDWQRGDFMTLLVKYYYYAALRQIPALPQWPPT